MKVPGWLQHELPEIRQKIAFVALLFGFLGTLSGGVVCASVFVDAQRATTATPELLLFGAGLLFGSAHACAWGYRTLSPATLNELGVAFIVIMSCIGFVMVTEHSDMRAIAAVSFGGLVLSGILFGLARLRSRSKNKTAQRLNV